MKVYSFVRITLTDSDFDDSEDPYERKANACFANWHKQEDKLPDSENSNACFSDYFPSISDRGGLLHCRMASRTWKTKKDIYIYIYIYISSPVCVEMYNHILEYNIDNKWISLYIYICYIYT